MAGQPAKLEAENNNIRTIAVGRSRTQRLFQPHYAKVRRQQDDIYFPFFKPDVVLVVPRELGRVLNIEDRSV